METRLKKSNSFSMPAKDENRSGSGTMLADSTPQVLSDLLQFEDTFNNFYATILLKKLRSLKSELRNQYVFNFEPSVSCKFPNAIERAIIVKSKSDNSLSKISIITNLEKAEFSIQGIPLYSKPTHLYNKIALIPFIGQLDAFDPEKFEGYIFQILDYCFQ